MKRLALASLAALMLSGCGTLPLLSGLAPSTGTESDAERSLYSLLGIEESGSEEGTTLPTSGDGTEQAPRTFESRGEVVLALLDGNDDGEVSRLEFETALKTLKPSLSAETIESFFVRLDVDGDEVLSTADFPRPKRPDMRRGGKPQFHSRLDPRGKHHPHGPRPEAPASEAPAEDPAAEVPATDPATDSAE